MRFRSANELTPADVGQRVTVRRRLPDGMASDVVGTLEEAPTEAVTVRDRHGVSIRIPRDEIVASRIIDRR